VETKFSGPQEPVDLPGALSTDSMRRDAEFASPTVDDSVVIGEERYGQYFTIHALHIGRALSCVVP